MGTSRTSSGSPSNVPMVPPWVPDVAPAPDAENPESAPPTGEDSTGDDEPVQPSLPSKSPIAPRGRFTGTRRSLGEFGRSGSSAEMKRGVGRYFKSGLGGAGVAARRFGGTCNTAAALYDALGGKTERPSPEIPSTGSAKRLISGIIDAVCPTNGTQDREASRDSVNEALSALLEQYPEADLSHLTEDQREFVIERFVSLDVFRRFFLDVGKAIQDKAPSATDAVRRLREVKEFIQAKVVAAFRSLREAGAKLSSTGVSTLVSKALRSAFNVFVEYAE